MLRTQNPPWTTQMLGCIKLQDVTFDAYFHVHIFKSLTVNSVGPVERVQLGSTGPHGNPLGFCKHGFDTQVLTFF